TINGLFSIQNNDQVVENMAFKGSNVVCIVELNETILAIEWVPHYSISEGTSINTELKKSEDGLIFTKIHEFSNIVVDAIVPADDGVYLTASSSGIYYSGDLINWSVPVGFSSLPDVLSFIIDPNNKKVMFIGSENSILKSTDTGKTVNSLKEGFNIDTLLFNCVLCSGDIVLTGTNYGVMKKNEKGQFFVVGLSDENINCLIEFNSKIYVGSNNDVFVQINNEWKPLGINKHIYALAKSDKSLFVGSSSGVYRVDNVGFVRVGEGQVQGNIFSLYVSGEKIFAGTDFSEDGGLFVSGDTGETWEKIPGTPGTDITSIFSDQQELFIGTWVLGLLYSEDGGLVWEEKNNDLGNLNITGIKYNFSSGIMYCTTSFGIYFSSNKGEEWKPLGSVLSSSRILDLSICSDTIIVASWDGLFQWKKNVFSAECEELSVFLHWDEFPDTAKVSGYEIYRSAQNDTEWELIKEFDAGNNNYLDNNVQNGVNYYYFVKSFDDKTPPNYFVSNMISVVPHIDTAPPEITVSSPSNHSTIGTNLVVLTGTVTDESGIDKVIVNGSEVSLSSNGSFSKTINLIKGINTITIIATDKKGNTATKTISVTYTPSAQETIITLQPDNSYMTVNSVSKEIDPGRGTKPVIIPEWSRTVVPIRAIVEALGGTISWESETRKVTINFETTTIELWIDNPRARVNGTMVYIDSDNHNVKPIIVNDRTMLPLRFVAESLGCIVSWDNDTRTITIAYGG
ncbi:MAG: stalk domain-containing protein, partial [Caldisericota bacterium]|nr:stalk domain-containing protein [Caldisericota bacterium]